MQHTRRLVVVVSLIAFSMAGCSGGDDHSHGDAGHSHSHGDAGDSHSGADGGHSKCPGAGDFCAYTTKRETSTEQGEYYVTYSPQPDPIPVKDLFELTVHVYKSEQKKTKITDVKLGIEARMPTHGHGMNTDPTVSKQSNGSFLIEGMKFHMPSDSKDPWVMNIKVKKGGHSHVAHFRVITEK